MVSLVDSGDLITSIDVYEELKVGGDSLFDWVCERKHMFVEYDDDTQNVLLGILRDYPKLVSDKSTDKYGADPHIIAVAKVRSCSVITREKMKPPEARKLGIPNVCQGLNVRCLNFVDFLREQGWLYARQR